MTWHWVVLLSVAMTGFTAFCCCAAVMGSKERIEKIKKGLHVPT